MVDSVVAEVATQMEEVAMAEVDACLGFGTVGARPIVGVGHSRCNQCRGGTMQILLPSRHRRSRRRLRNWGTYLSNQE